MELPAKIDIFETRQCDYASSCQAQIRTRTSSADACGPLRVPCRHCRDTLTPISTVKDVRKGVLHKLRLRTADEDATPYVITPSGAQSGTDKRRHRYMARLLAMRDPATVAG